MKNYIKEKLNNAKLRLLTHYYEFQDNNKGMGVIEIVLINFSSGFLGYYLQNTDYKHN